MSDAVNKMIDARERREALAEEIRGPDMKKRLTPRVAYDLGHGLLSDCVDIGVGDLHTQFEGYAALCYAALTMRRLIEARVKKCPCPECRDMLGIMDDAETLANDLMALDIEELEDADV